MNGQLIALAASKYTGGRGVVCVRGKRYPAIILPQSLFALPAIFNSEKHQNKKKKNKNTRTKL
jgi:hypothetical protein